MTDAKIVQRPSVIERAVAQLPDQQGPAKIARPDVDAQSPLQENRRHPDPVQPPSASPTSKIRIPINLKRLESDGIFAPGRTPNRTTEEFRLIKRSVLLNVHEARAAQSKNPNLVMVTSSRQGEGKSFVAFNLALSLAAETSTHVLLIDADASRGSVIDRLNIETDKGFLDLLREPNPNFADVVLHTDLPHLSILPAGRPDPLSTELLSGSAAESLLAEISQRYPDRIVVLDAPPVLATSEPAALALHVGQIVFVVESGRTTKTIIKEALSLIGTCPRVGFVLNRAVYQFGSARFGSYYGYYKKSYKKHHKSTRKQLRQL